MENEFEVTVAAQNDIGNNVGVWMNNTEVGNANDETPSELEFRLEIAKRLQQLRDSMRENYGELPDSTLFIRAERGRRG